MKLCSLVMGAVLGALLGTGVHAADTTQPAPLDLKPALRAYAHQVEDETGGLMQRRSDAPPGAAAVLDLQIDLHVLADAVASRAESDSVSPDTAACAYLRARELCAAAVEASHQFGSAALTSEQLDTLKQLHQMTFAVPASNSREQMDQLSGEIGKLLLKVFGPLPAGMTDLPFMRPRGADASEPGIYHERSLEDLVAAARRAAVGADLKRALVALADQTSTAASDAARKDDFDASRRALLHGVEITEALQHGGLVDPQERQNTESQLTRAILLFLDVRTRAAAKARIEDLVEYQQMLNRVQVMHLSAELRDRLIPAFTWVRDHPDDGGPDVMDSIEAYVHLCTAHDTHERPGLPAASRHAMDVLEKRFAKQRATFLADAADPAASDEPQEDLSEDISELTRTAATIALIEQVPAEMKSLAQYRARANGGLDRRAAAACGALGSDSEGPGTEAALRFLTDLRSMARLAEQLTQPAPPAEVMQLYARDHLAEFNRLRGELLTALVGQGAARELSQPQRAQLDAALALGDALIEAGKIEGIPHQQALDRWVDWDVPAEAIGAMLESYRDATADAIAAFGLRDVKPFKAWQAEYARTHAFLDLLDSVESKTDACARLPSGWLGAVAKLLTPMNEQPFAVERLASLALSRTQGPGSAEPDVLLQAISEWDLSGRAR